jgi:short-subunit dehydrogenase
MTELSGSRVLVIGAAGGLGSRIVRRLADAGTVLAVSGRDATRLDALDVAAERIVADVRSVSASASVVAEAESRLGGLDAVIIASGVVAFGPASELDPATVAELFAVNTTSPIDAIRAALPALARSADEGRKPVVVTISGIVAEAPTAGLAAYSASKSALAAFMVAAGRENRRAGIRLIDARPGHTETGLVTRAIAGAAPAFPAGLDPDHVADVIVAAIASDARDLPSSAF